MNGVNITNHSLKVVWNLPVPKTPSTAGCEVPRWQVGGHVLTGNGNRQIAFCTVTYLPNRSQLLFPHQSSNSGVGVGVDKRCLKPGESKAGQKGPKLAYTLLASFHPL